MKDTMIRETDTHQHIDMNTDQIKRSPKRTSFFVKLSMQDENTTPK